MTNYFDLKRLFETLKDLTDNREEDVVRSIIESEDGTTNSAICGQVIIALKGSSELNSEVEMSVRSVVDSFVLTASYKSYHHEFVHFSYRVDTGECGINIKGTHNFFHFNRIDTTYIKLLSNTLDYLFSEEELSFDDFFTKVLESSEACESERKISPPKYLYLEEGNSDPLSIFVIDYNDLDKKAYSLLLRYGYKEICFTAIPQIVVNGGKYLYSLSFISSANNLIRENKLNVELTILNREEVDDGIIYYFDKNSEEFKDMINQMKTIVFEIFNDKLLINKK